MSYFKKLLKIRNKIGEEEFVKQCTNVYEYVRSFEVEAQKEKEEERKKEIKQKLVKISRMGYEYEYMDNGEKKIISMSISNHEWKHTKENLKENYFYDKKTDSIIPKTF